MIIWSIFWGAVLGWMWPGYGDFGVFLGAFLGVFAGFSLRWVVRSEVEAAQKRHRPQVVAPQASAAPVVKQAAPAEDDGGFKDFEESNPQAAATPLPTQSTPVTAADSEAAWAGELAPNGLPRTPAAPASVAPAPKTVTRLPPEPVEPNAIEQAVIAAKNWFLGGNTIVRVGLVILFIGLSFLARYAASAGLLPVEFRLAAIGAAAIALLAVGFRKRHDKPGFALALQGAGVAVMYLTVFAAFRLYGLLEPLPSFALMIIVCGSAARWRCCKTPARWPWPRLPAALPCRCCCRRGRAAMWGFSATTRCSTSPFFSLRTSAPGAS
jgi:uncharacterized membrane protein